MKLAALATLVIGLGACRIDAPSPGAAATGAAAPPGGADGFFARDDHGGRRPLALRQLGAQVTRGAATLRTHLTLEIAGPDDARVEAVMRLPVPRGAAVTGATLWVDERPMNAAFVQRDRARQIYQSIVSRRRDPALVTWAGPDAVAVSIFPVEPHKSRRFALDWVEPVAAEVSVPILRDGARIVGRAAMEIDGRPIAAGAGDRVPVAAPQPTAAVWTARAPGDPFQRILVRGAGEAGPLRVVIVAETSVALGTAARARVHGALQSILDALPASARVTILAADWNVSAIAEAVAPNEAERALGRLDAVISAGALHLERALTDALARARRDNGVVLFVGGGGDPFPGDALRAPLEAARDADLRLSIVTVGAPPAPLADAAAITGGVALPARTISETMPQLLAALKPWPPRPALEARGLDAWRPLEASDGGTLWIGRALEGPHLAAGAPPAASVEPTALLALWDRARLSWSERGNRAGAGGATRAALAPLRALLVLENDREYARYGLAAPAAVAEEGKTETEANLTGRQADGLYGLRGRDSTADSEIGAAMAEEQVRNIGLLGALGSAAQGHADGPQLLGTGAYGVGGLGGRRARAPDVVPELPTVRGSLDREIVRRIVRRHANELRYCYQQEARSRGDEIGRIVAEFTISAAGKVLTAAQRMLANVNPPVARCFLDAIRRWEFPTTTGGGSSMVTETFTLFPTGDGPPPTPTSPNSAPTPASEEALTILAGHDPVAARVTRVCERLGLDRTSDPETAAWSIDRSSADLTTVLLVARLLAVAERLPDAVRVLSERAASAPDAIAAELRRLDAARDAQEVEALQKRQP